MVTLQGVAGSARVVTATELDEWHDVDGAIYAIRSRAGDTSPATTSRTGLSIRELVSRLANEPGAFAGLAPDSIRLASVVDPRNSYVSVLSGSQLGASGSNGFDKGLLPLVSVVGRNDAISYLRPLTPDVDDVNVRDNIQGNSESPLTLDLSTTGSVLHPRVSASPEEVGAGEPVSFTVDVPDAPPAGLTYAWQFDGGDSSAARAPTHTWDDTGSYTATVTVTGADGSVGQASVSVAVGPRPTASPSASATTGGGTDPDKSAPTRGPDETSKGELAGGKVTPTPRPTPAATPTSSTPSTGPAPVVGGASGGATVEPRPAGRPSSTTPAPTPVPASGDEVSGLLLSGAVVAPDLGGPDPVDLSAPSARESRPDGSVDPLVWWAFAVPALLLTGAWGERRPRGASRRRLPRLRA